MGRNRYITLPVLSSVLLLFGGCVSTQSSQEADADAPAQARRSVDHEATQTQDRTSTEDGESTQRAGDISAMDRVLADRRRGDFPEIETEADGFTITEQIRIAGDSHSRYDQALRLLQQERYEEAISLLTELTEDAPEITAPYVDLGIAYGHIGDLERAAAALETATLLSPDHPIVRNELGIIYRRSGRFDDARSEYEMVLAVFSDFHFARRNLAVLCDLYLADVECALQNYRMYLDSVGEDSEVEIWIADLSSRSVQDQ